MNNNINDIQLKRFSPEEIAGICKTSINKITEMIEKGIFIEIQKRSKNKRDILSTKEEIIDIYRKNTS